MAIPSGVDEIQDSKTVRTRRLIFSVLCVGYVVTSLDMMIVNVAFPALQEDFSGYDTAALSWTLNAYTITFAALLVPAGRIADQVGRRRGFLFGLVLFTVASALCAAAPTLPLLVAARILQAVGAAALVPTSMGLLLQVYPKELQQSAVRNWTAIGGIAAAMAPIIGGLLVEIDWRWIFLINIPLGVAAVVVGRRTLPANATTPGPIPDITGAVAVAASCSALVLALVQGPSAGWGSATTLLGFVVFALFAVLAVVRNRRHVTPVIPMHLMKLPAYVRANISALVFSAAFSAMLLSLMLWTQEVRGYSAVQTGLSIAPGTILMPIFAVLTGRIVKAIGAPTTAAVGCLLLAGGIAWWAMWIDGSHPYVVAVLPGAILAPVGTIIANAALTGIVAGSLPAADYAAGSGVNLMLRQLGFAVGVAAFMAVYGKPGTDHVSHAFRNGWYFAIAAAIVAAIIALLIRVPKASDAATKEENA